MISRRKFKRHSTRIIPIDRSVVTQPVSATISNLPHLITIKEAAALLGVSVRTVHTLIKQKQLTHFRVRGSLRFDPVHLNEYLQKRIIRAAA